MADYGSKNSTQRAKWWDQVVAPISMSARDLAVGGYFTNRGAWMAEPKAGGRLDPSKWPKELRKNAEAAGEYLGIPFTVNVTLANLGKAVPFASQLWETTKVVRAALAETTGNVEYIAEQERTGGVAGDGEGEPGVDDEVATEGEGGEVTTTDTTGGEVVPWYRKPVAWVVGGAVAAGAGMLALIFGGRR